MALAPGSRLGPYEIVSVLAAGAMGEVYRATDTRLGREVAVKVLPVAFSHDADRLRRFEQEARAASALNHPNILSVFDVGAHNGTPYVVTELLEGKTIRALLATGPLSSRIAIGYAIQMAQGLAAAHEKGIVHRDLKPENLFVTEDDRVKILDFGLAKLVQPEATSGGQTSVPTVSPGTEPGVVMGTAGYMAPEQVRGLPADHRSDIFSLGAILFEMLSGRRAFSKDSALETMSAILREEPPDLSEINHRLSPDVARLVGHCLEKTPAQRFQSARDLAYDLESLSRESGTVHVRQPQPKRLHFRAVTTILAIVAAFLGGAWIGGLMSQLPAPTSTRLTFRRGTVREARFVPDGQTIIYSAEWDGSPSETFSTRTSGRQSRSLFSNAALVSVSPLGELAIFRNPGYTLGANYSDPAGTLARVALDGAAPKDILDGVIAADWALDGQRLAVVRFVNGKTRLEFPIGTVLYETGGTIGQVRVSPKGDRLAFVNYRNLGGGTANSIVVVDLQGRTTTLTDGSGGALAWSADGSEIWFGDQNLNAVTLTGRRRLVWSPLGEIKLLDIGRDGRVLVARTTIRREVYGKPISATAERNYSWLDITVPLRISSDARFLLLNGSGERSGADQALYLRGMDAALPVPIGTGGGFDLSPDGKWVLAMAGYGRSDEKMMLLPTGPGQPREIPIEPLACETAFFSPDGRRFVFGASSSGKAPRMYIQDLDGGPPRPVTAEGLAPRAQDTSPPSADGRIVVRDGSLNPFVLPIEGGIPIPVKGATQEEYFPGWTKDGQLYAVRASPLPAQVFRLDPVTGTRQHWKEILPADRGGVTAVDWVVITPDGSAYAYGFVRVLSDLYVIEGLK